MITSSSLATMRWTLSSGSLLSTLMVPLPLRPHPAELHKARRLDGWPNGRRGFETRRLRATPHHEVGYFSACSASYSGLDQPPLPSLCSGSAAARNAARSGSITVLPSFLNSSASFCSDSRICFVALVAASPKTSSNTFLSASESFGQT